MDQDNSAIRISVANERERGRRRRELLLAAALFLVVVVLSFVGLKFLGVNVYLFLALFNLNFIFLLLVLLLVVRNGVKLLLDRRRNVLGSRLRTRLVLAFVSLSLIPTVLMYLVSVQFVQTSVDFWFKSQVENSMEQALDLGQAVYTAGKDRMGRLASGLAETLARKSHLPPEELQTLLDEKSREYGLVMLGLVDNETRDRVWSWSPRFETAWRSDMHAAVDWKALARQPRFWAMWWPGAGEDFVIGVQPVELPPAGDADATPWTGYIVLGESLGSGLLYKMDSIARGFEEYSQLKTMKRPLTVALFFIMGVLTLLIIFGAMWFGFRLAKELSAPIMALAQGTERIARGDLSVRLEDTSKDEIGLLVRSFNRMAQDLEAMRTGLTAANLQLSRTNQEVEERGRYIETVLNNIAAGVISLDPEGRISTVNKAAAAMLGVESETLAGRAPSEFLEQEHIDLLEQARAFLTESPGAVFEHQLGLRVRGLERKLLVNVVGLGAGEAASLVAVFEDITEIEKMQRMAAWREVARRIAHEIKNPLTPIKLSAQRLERKFGDRVQDRAFRECTGLIVTQVEHLQQMVQEFSAFAKLPEITPRPGRLEPLVEEVVALFQHSHSNILWNLDIPAPLPVLSFDRQGLRRGLMNVLANSVEALENASPLPGQPSVTVSAVFDKPRNLVRLTFHDNGPGLNAEERSRLFEPYFSRKKGGTGLGLTILKSIVTDHRGYVRAFNAPEGGAVLVLELPVG
jgi:two-component system, NtrC family, nitrogen regulation sensor histidine kinase NtrY